MTYREVYPQLFDKSRTGSNKGLFTLTALSPWIDQKLIAKYLKNQDRGLNRDNLPDRAKAYLLRKNRPSTQAPASKVG